MNKSLLIEKLLVGLGVMVGVGVLLFVVAGVWIGQTVKTICKQAETRYGNDCVIALTKQLQNEDEPFQNRNDATWALGQLGDARALPVLEQYVTETMPDREPLAKTLSQYEIRKAVGAIKGGVNITAFLWR